MGLPDNWLDIFLWVIALPGGWLIAKLIKATIYPYLHRLAVKSESSMDDAIIEAFSRVTVPFGWVTGVWIAYHYSHLFEELKPDIRKGTIVFSLIIFSWALANLMADMARIYMMRMGQKLPSTSIFTNILKIIVYVLGLVFIMHALNIPIAPALTALGVGGLAVALALQDTLSNLFSGLQIIATRKIKPGDYIRLDNGDEGFVEDVSWRNTTIRALGNHIIIVPNSTMAGGIIKNFILPDAENSVQVKIGVAYDSDLAKVEQITVEVARKIQQTVPGAVKEHEPSIRYSEFADSSINFGVNLRAADFVSQYLIKHEFIKAIHARFAKEGIDIPFPVRTVYLKKENTGNSKENEIL